MFASVRAVLFDAVGTLIRPDPPVAEVYSRVGRRFGSALSLSQVDARFTAALARHEAEDAGLSTTQRPAPRRFARNATDNQQERRRWQRIVAEVFHDVPSAEDRLFTTLWDHFAQCQHWTVYDDVADTWDQLAARDLSLGIASNFDDRLPDLCRGKSPLSRCQNLFWSADIGYPKPSPEFFVEVERRLGLTPPEILLVGDDRENDFHGAQAAGWAAVFLDRHKRQAVDGQTVYSLRQLVDLLPSD